MEDSIVLLDIGGALFRTTRSTLCKGESFFSRMLMQNSSWWLESTLVDNTTKKPIFIDRGDSEFIYDYYIRNFRICNDLILSDPDLFPRILSYLRSGKIVFTSDDNPDVLERFLLEADFYQLRGLIDQIQSAIQSLNNRAQHQLGDVNYVYKSVSAHEVNHFFDEGWQYVDSHAGDEAFACATINGKRVTSWQYESCTVCNELMSIDKFVKHATFIKPTMIVVRRLRNYAPSSTSGSENVLQFDQSFG